MGFYRFFMCCLYAFYIDFYMFFLGSILWYLVAIHIQYNFSDFFKKSVFSSIWWFRWCRDHSGSIGHAKNTPGDLFSAPELDSGKNWENWKNRFLWKSILIMKHHLKNDLEELLVEKWSAQWVLQLRFLSRITDVFGLFDF